MEGETQPSHECINECLAMNRIIESGVIPNRDKTNSLINPFKFQCVPPKSLSLQTLTVIIEALVVIWYFCHMFH